MVEQPALFAAKSHKSAISDFETHPTVLKAPTWPKWTILLPGRFITVFLCFVCRKTLCFVFTYDSAVIRFCQVKPARCANTAWRAHDQSAAVHRGQKTALRPCDTKWHLNSWLPIMTEEDIRYMIYIYIYIMYNESYISRDFYMCMQTWQPPTAKSSKGHFDLDFPCLPILMIYYIYINIPQSC